ncbi:MAG TPA: hypothetical protein VLG28_11275 [Acidimicrobiia bacterium]|jgi:hypothetical protein|nr:hypothetical protein [Acidimicrobiia bacterium]
MGLRFMRKAHVARGKGDEAMAFAAEISAHWKETYGTELTWGFEVGGEWGTLYWFSDHDSMANLEAEMMASMANEETGKRLAEGADLFEGRTEDRLIMTM